MPEKTSTSSPSSPRRSCDADGRGLRLLCAAELPEVSLALAHRSLAVQPRHVHDSLTLGLVTAGTRRIETPGRAGLVRAGEMYALPPGLPHGCAPADGPCSALVFSIAPASLPVELLAAAPPVRLFDAPLRQDILRLAEAFETSAGGLERQSLLATALERLAGLVHGGELAARPQSPGPLDAAVRRARELLEAVVDGPGPSLRELAEACGAEMFALHRAFTRATGLPPHAFQTHLRLRRAKALLRAGATPTEAALAAGFCDQSHMHRHFTRLVGFTPAQYASAHRARSGGATETSGES